MDLPKLDVSLVIDLPGADVPFIMDLSEADVPLIVDLSEADVPLIANLPKAGVPLIADLPKADVPLIMDFPEPDLPWIVHYGTVDPAAFENSDSSDENEFCESKEPLPDPSSAIAGPSKPRASRSRVRRPARKHRRVSATHNASSLEIEVEVISETLLNLMDEPSSEANLECTPIEAEATPNDAVAAATGTEEAAETGTEEPAVAPTPAAPRIPLRYQTLRDRSMTYALMFCVLFTSACLLIYPPFQDYAMGTHLNETLGTSFGQNTSAEVSVAAKLSGYEEWMMLLGLPFMLFLCGF